MCPIPAKCWQRHNWRAWPIDEEYRVVLLRIPTTVNLNDQFEQKGFYGGRFNIATLPPELQGTILSYLPPIDRITLALSCKSLASAAITSSHLRAPAFTPWLGAVDLPSRDLLLQRLAHGWTDKSRLRYCQTCRRILPKDAEYFQKELRLGPIQSLSSKKLPYSIKVGMDKKEWKKLSNRKKHEHIIKLWAESSREDSSVFSCNRCWKREYNEDGPEGRDLEKGLEQTHDDQTTFTPRLPVECPCCLIHSLVNTYKEPRKPVVRPFLWKWTKKTLTWTANGILIFVYVIFLLLKSPLTISYWAYKKCRAKG